MALSTALLFSLVIVSSSPALESAKKHLAKGEASDVAFDLEGQTFSDADKPEAAKVLAAASKVSLEQKDSVVALHCAQRALKLSPKNAGALEAAARAAFAEQQFAAAEQYTDSWVAQEPKNAAAHLLRAELAAEAGEWDRVLGELHGLKLEGEAAVRAGALEQKAKKEKGEKETELGRARSVYGQKAKPVGPKEIVVESAPAAGVLDRVAAATPDVVVYGTSWCGYCRKAREWLHEHDVAFIDKDVETDDGAQEELDRKKADHGIRRNGIPVIDARGKLIVGFSAAALEHALR